MLDIALFIGSLFMAFWFVGAVFQPGGASWWPRDYEKSILAWTSDMTEADWKSLRDQ